MGAFRFFPGHRYFGAADVPFFVTRGMIDSEASKAGFADLMVWERDELVLPFKPHTDDWNTLAFAKFVGESPRTQVMPDEVAFVFDLDFKPEAPVPNGPPPLPTDKPLMVPEPKRARAGAIAFSVAFWGSVAAGLFWWADRRVRG